MANEPCIENLRQLKDFLSQFEDEDLEKVHVDEIVWAGSIAKGNIRMKYEYVKERMKNEYKVV